MPSLQSLPVCVGVLLEPRGHQALGTNAQQPRAAADGRHSSSELSLTAPSPLSPGGATHPLKVLLRVSCFLSPGTPRAPCVRGRSVSERIHASSLSFSVVSFVL